MRSTRRYTVTDDSQTTCSISIHVDCELGQAGDVRYFWAPKPGGYVRDVTDQPGTLGWQVCEGLAGRGNTLTCPSGNGRLAGLIRREARKALRDAAALDL